MPETDSDDYMTFSLPHGNRKRSFTLDSEDNNDHPVCPPSKRHRSMPDYDQNLNLSKLSQSLWEVTFPTVSEAESSTESDVESVSTDPVSSVPSSPSQESASSGSLHSSIDNITLEESSKQFSKSTNSQFDHSTLLEIAKLLGEYSKDWDARKWLSPSKYLHYRFRDHSVYGNKGKEAFEGLMSRLKKNVESKKKESKLHRILKELDICPKSIAGYIGSHGRATRH